MSGVRRVFRRSEQRSKKEQKLPNGAYINNACVMPGIAGLLNEIHVGVSIN